MDVGQQHDGGVRADPPFDLPARRHFKPQPGQPRRAVGDIDVGVKVAAFGQQHAALPALAPPQLGCRHQQLEQVHRSGIARQHFAGPGADQARDAPADALRQIDPAMLVPRADQGAAPLLLDQVGDPGGRFPRQRAERIAVEIRDAVGQREQVAASAERIGGVRRARLGDRHRHQRPPLPSACSISATVAAHAALSGAISSTWPVRGMKRTRTSSPKARIR